MIHVYTGEGAGKTTAALGLALRSLGRGKKVALVQFLKKRPSGEISALARFDGCRIRRFGTDNFLIGRPPAREDYREAEAGLAEAERILEGGEVDLLILDEVNVALDLGLVPLSRAEKLLAGCPKEIEIVFTGRNCPSPLMARADYVSEIREVRHPFRQGVPPRGGVEY